MESILFLNSRPLWWCGSMGNPLLELPAVTQKSVDFKGTQPQRRRGGQRRTWANVIYGAETSRLRRLQLVTVWTPPVVVRNDCCANTSRLCDKLNIFSTVNYPWKIQSAAELVKKKKKRFFFGWQIFGHTFIIRPEENLFPPKVGITVAFCCHPFVLQYYSALNSSFLMLLPVWLHSILIKRTELLLPSVVTASISYSWKVVEILRQKPKIIIMSTIINIFH